MKRLLAILLVLCLSAGLFAGCGEKEPQQPAQQENNLPPVEDDGVMKILLIGHSLGVDSAFLFPDICKGEGVENLVVGFLYHSGCLMIQHVDYANANAAQYAYYEYDISKDDGWQRANAYGVFDYCPAGAANDIYIEDGSIAQTLEFGIQRHDWDMVILQAGSSESANYLGSYYTSRNKELDLPGYTRQLMDYVLSKDIEPRSVPKFAWNMVWSSPKDPSACTESTNKMINDFFEGSELKYYEKMAQVCKDEVAPAFDWAYILPNGTTIQNLKSSTLENKAIYRDYAHVTDFGRYAAAYTWYCTIFGKDITECKLEPVNYKVVLDQFCRQYKKNLELTEEQKQILVECVGNALSNPYQMTQSQF